MTSSASNGNPETQSKKETLSKDQVYNSRFNLNKKEEEKAGTTSVNQENGKDEEKQDSADGKRLSLT